MIAHADKKPTEVKCIDNDIVVEGHALIFLKGVKPKANKEQLLPLLEPGKIENPMPAYKGSTIIDMSIPRTNICNSFNHFKNFVKDEKLTGTVTFSASGKHEIVNVLNGLTLHALKEMKIIKKRLVGKLRNGHEAFFMLLEIDNQLIVIGMKQMPLKDSTLKVDIARDNGIITPVIIPGDLPQLTKPAVTEDNTTNKKPTDASTSTNSGTSGAPQTYIPLNPNSPIKPMTEIFDDEFEELEESDDDEIERKELPPHVIRGVMIPRNIQIDIPLRNVKINETLFPYFPGPRLENTYQKFYLPKVLLTAMPKTESSVEEYLRRNQASGGVHYPGGARRYGFHEGTDISARELKDKSIIAPMDGFVYAAGWFGSGGNTIYLQHPIPNTGKFIYTAYRHLKSYKIFNGRVTRNTWKFFTKPIQIKKGEVIGIIGSTGRSSGPHLHFEVRVPIDGKPETAPVNSGFRSRRDALTNHTLAVSWTEFNQEFDEMCYRRKKAELENAAIVLARNSKAHPIISAGLCSYTTDERLKNELGNRFSNFGNLPKPYGIVALDEMKADYPFLKYKSRRRSLRSGRTTKKTPPAINRSTTKRKPPAKRR